MYKNQNPNCIKVYNNTMDGFVDYLREVVSSSKKAVLFKPTLAAGEHLEITYRERNDQVKYKVGLHKTNRNGELHAYLHFNLRLQVGAKSISLTVAERNYDLHANPLYKLDRNLFEVLAKKPKNWKKVHHVDSEAIRKLEGIFKFPAVTLAEEVVDLEKFYSNFDLFDHWLETQLKKIIESDLNELFKNSYKSDKGTSALPIQGFTFSIK